MKITKRRIQFAWKYRRLLWKYRGVIRHRRQIAGTLAAAWIAAVVLMARHRAA